MGWGDGPTQQLKTHTKLHIVNASECRNLYTANYTVILSGAQQ